MKRVLLMAALALGLAACDDNENSSAPVAINPPPTMPPINPPPEERVTLNVGVFAPTQNMTAGDDSHMELDFLVGLFGSKAVAQSVNGYAPVNNANLLVQVIAADGSVARTINAAVTPLGNGRYEVTLPPGEDIASDCIIVTEGQLNMPLRVPLVRRNINITPVTEFLAAQLASGTRDYSNISLTELSELLDQVDNITIPPGSNGSVEDIIAALTEIAGDDVTAAVQTAEAANEQPAANPSVAFNAYDGQYITLGMQGFNGNDDIAPNGSIDVGGTAFDVTIRSDGNNGAELFFTTDGSDEFDFELFNGSFAFGETFATDDDDSGSVPVRVLSDGSVVVPGENETDLPAAGQTDSNGESVGSIEIAPATTLYSAANGAILLETYRAKLTEYVAVDNNGDDVPDGLDISQPRSVEFYAEPNFYMQRPSNLAASDFTGQYGSVDMFISLESNEAEFCVEASQYTFSSGTGSEVFEDDFCITRNGASNPAVVTIDNAQGPDAQLTVRDVAASGEFELFMQTPNGNTTRAGNASPGADFYTTLVSDINDQNGNSAALTINAKLPTTTPALDGKNFNIQGVGFDFGNSGQQAFTDYRRATMSFSQVGTQLQLNLGNVRKDVFTQPGQDSQDREAPRRSQDTTGIANLPITVTSNGRIRGEMLAGGAVVRINGFIDASGEVLIAQLVTENADGNAASAMLIYGTPTDEVAVTAADTALATALVGGWELSAEPAGIENLSDNAFLVFGADNEYHQVDINDPNNGSGFEFGTFTVVNGGLNVENRVDGNGDSGLVDRNGGERSNTFPITVVGDTLTLTVPGEGDFEFTRVASTTGQLAGCWDISPSQDPGEVVFCYLSGSRYLAIQPIEENDETGIEFGSFTASGNVIEHTATIDTSGSSLTTDWIAPTEFAVSGDALTLTILDDDSAGAEEFDVNFSRVK